MGLGFGSGSGSGSVVRVGARRALDLPVRSGREHEVGGELRGGQPLVVLARAAVGDTHLVG